jgi:hypothetical protein
MSNHDFNSGLQNAQRGNGTAPQQPGESAQAHKDRVAGADYARKQNG